jgi:hypothetical protein
LSESEYFGLRMSAILYGDAEGEQRGWREGDIVKRLYHITKVGSHTVMSRFELVQSGNGI